MKKIISIMLALLMLACVNVSAENPITVEVDFGTVQFDTSPVNINGRVLVPVRAIFEAMGAEVIWNAGTRTVTSKLDNTTVVMQIDSPTMRINGEPKSLDVAPQIIDDRTLVPARAAAEAFGGRVQWQGDQNRVIISTRSFTKKLETIQSHSSVRKLELGGTEAVSAFNLSYFPEYETLTAAADGTDFEIVSSDDSYCAILGIRSDIYMGDTPTLTQEYVASIAEDMVSVAEGTLISSDIVTICNTQFMKIYYTAYGTAEGITDHTADIITYMGIHDGVVYTMTLSTYGNVPFTVQNDLNYMTTTLLIK